MNRFATSIIAVQLFASLFATESAWALQCGPDSSEPTSAMFRGEVITVVDRNTAFNRALYALNAWGIPRRYAVRPYEAAVATFKVKSSWMGVTTSSVKVTSPGSGGSFAVGSEYLVYAHGPIDDLHADMCSRTRIFVGTNDKYLETLPELPLTGDSLLEALPIGALAAAGAVALFVVYWELRRRRIARTS